MRLRPQQQWLYTLTLLWNKATNDFSPFVLMQHHVMCIMGYYSPEWGLKGCCDNLKNKLFLYLLAAYLCRTVFSCSSQEVCSSLGRVFVQHMLLLPVTWWHGPLLLGPSRALCLELVASWLESFGDWLHDSSEEEKRYFLRFFLSTVFQKTQTCSLF